MPAAPAAPPAAAPVAPAPAATAAPAKVGLPEVHLSVADGSTVRGSARSNSPAMLRARASLAKRGNVGEDGKESTPIKETAVQSTPAELAGQVTPPKDLQAPAPAKPAETPAPAKPAEVAKPGEAAPALKPGEKAPGPWQLKEKYEKLAKTFERENVELKRQLSAAGDTATVLARAEKAEARMKELEAQVAYHDASADPEFVSKYEAPLRQAWVRADRAMKEITITSEDGNSRPASIDDITMLVNLPMGKAREQANALFGDSANDVMGFRNRIRDLVDEQETALGDLKKSAVDRKRQAQVAARVALEESGKLWEQFGKDDVKKNSLLQPKEGDDEWNGRLEKTQKYVEKAMRGWPTDPKLTLEQRVQVVRELSNVRARAVAYPMLVIQNNRLQTQLADLQKIIDGYKKTDPGGEEAAAAGGTGGPGGAPASGVTMQGIKAKLRGLAR